MQVLSITMTPDRLSEVLSELGWQTGELAKRLWISERTVRRWLSGQAEVPDRIAYWLEAVVRVMQSAPPPPGRQP